MSEKRQRERTQTSTPARLISGQLCLECTILDISQTGARLLIEPGQFLPKTFRLKSDEGREDRSVEVVWRNRTQLGVRF